MNYSKFLIIFLFGNVFLPVNAQFNKLYVNNQIDSTILNSLLSKRVVMIGEVHEEDANIEIQTDLLSYLSKKGYKILFEVGPSYSAAANAYLKDPNGSLLSSVFRNSSFSFYKYEEKYFDRLLRKGFSDSTYYFDQDVNMNEFGFYLYYYRDEFYPQLTDGMIQELIRFYTSQDIIDDSLGIVNEVYENLARSEDTISSRGVEFMKIYREGEKMNAVNFDKNRLLKKMLRTREEGIKEFLRSHYSIYNSTTKIVFVTGRYHAKLNSKKEIGLYNYGHWLSEQIGRDNIYIIQTIYGNRYDDVMKEPDKMIRKGFLDFKDDSVDMYIRNPVSTVDLLLILH